MMGQLDRPVSDLLGHAAGLSLSKRLSIIESYLNSLKVLDAPMTTGYTTSPIPISKALATPIAAVDHPPAPIRLY